MMSSNPIEFTINIVPVTKKNSQQIKVNRRTGARYISQSEAYRQFEHDVCCLIPKRFKVNICYPVNVKAIYYVKNNSRIDKTNLESALLDALVAAGVLEDDSALAPPIVVSTDGSRVYHDKENPRIEVTIERVCD